MKLGWVVFFVALAAYLPGCTLFSQPREQAFVRNPGERQYRKPPDAARTWATEQRDYALLSQIVYADQPDGTLREALGSSWTLWEGFPDEGLAREADRQGLAFQVWQKSDSPTVIAVAFRGTDGADDWRSNLRWLWRYVPWVDDQYTLTGNKVGAALVREIERRLPAMDGNPVLVATGHSLGGGLAQYLAYSLPRPESGSPRVPRVSHVFAFDPSPVTGWYSAPAKWRDDNARGLQIDRAFEHGEILAYLRLLMSYLNPPTASDPAIREIRYNFSDSINPLKSHGIHDFTAAIVEASKPESDTAHVDR